MKREGTYYSRSRVIKQLDRIFSKYIRLKYSVDGYVQCYTCGKWERVEKMTVGHFVKRQYIGTRFDERNVKPQCRGCNYFLQGNDSVFAEKLKEEYGENILQILELERRKRLEMSDLLLLLEFYKKELANLKKNM